MQKKILTLAAPLAIAALALSACGSSSTPAASSPSNSQSSATQSTDATSSGGTSSPTAATSDSESAAASENAFGAADTKLDVVAKGFAAQAVPGATLLSSAKAKQALASAEGAQAALKSAKIEPAACKAAIVESAANLKLPADLNMALVMSSTDGSVSFMDDPSKSYFQASIDSGKKNADVCKNYSMEMGSGAAAVKATVEMVAFEPEGVTGDQVMGTMTKTVAEVSGQSSTSTVTTVMVVRGDHAIQVQKSGTSGDDRAAASELAKKAQDYWASH